MEVKCQICDKIFNKLQSLAYHIKIHNITSKDYFDKFLKKDENEGICNVCNKPTIFYSLVKGYSNYHNKCFQQTDNFKKLISKKRKHSNKKAKKIDNKEGILCEYGCGQEAKYIHPNKKLSCDTHHFKCPIYRESRKGEGNPFFNKKHSEETKKGISKTSKGRKILPFIQIENKNEDIICSLGCGRKAKYKSSSKYEIKKYYCEDYSSKCPAMKVKNRESHNAEWNKKVQKYKLTINPEKKLCECGCEKIGKYTNINKKWCCSKYVSQCIAVRNKNGFDIEGWKSKYPTFAKVEEIRYDPDKPGEKVIQGHCKNHNCENSKEKGGWFTLTFNQFYERIRSLEHQKGNDGNYFYCCDECKNQCPLFNLHGDPYRDKDLYYTDQEYNVFRLEVLKNDNNICHFCGEQEATIVHHTLPKKLEPFHALDPDYGISVCEECHHFIHRSGSDCSNGKLASIVCFP